MKMEVGVRNKMHEGDASRALSQIETRHVVAYQISSFTGLSYPQYSDGSTHITLVIILSYSLYKLIYLKYSFMPGPRVSASAVIQLSACESVECASRGLFCASLCRFFLGCSVGSGIQYVTRLESLARELTRYEWIDRPRGQGSRRYCP